jgi:ATP-dependent Clp protease ATP-binding subunit ClpA
VFKALGKKDVRAILDLQLTELNQRLAERKIAVSVSAKAKRWLVENGYDAHNGVRPLRRLIQDELEDRLAETLLAGRFGVGDVIRVDVKGKSGAKELTLTTAKE